MGVMYHGEYVKYLEIGRTELLRNCDLVYKELEKMGIITPVLNLDLKYIRPSYYDQILQMDTWISAFEGSRITFSYEIKDESGNLLTIANTQLVFLDAKTKRPVGHLTEKLKSKVNHYIIEKI
jgi:acyl-CoA thioester hydrolase